VAVRRQRTGKFASALSLASGAPTGKGMASLGRTAALLAALQFLTARAAAAEVYRWTDEKGSTHFTEDLSLVPARHREAARAAAREERPDPLQLYRAPAAPAPSDPAWNGSGDPQHHIPFRRFGSLMVVDVRINDRVVAPFLADTGASGIAIPHALARELGIRIGADTPTVMVNTANGVVEEPLVRLDSVALGKARVEGLHANVSSSMEFGLLGGSFFNNFIYQVDAALGLITLVPNASVRAGLSEAQWRARFRALRDPLAELEAHLEAGVDRRAGRLAELEAHREALRAELRALEEEANRSGVPQAWR